jgi:integrase
LLQHEHASWSRFNQVVCALRFLERVTLGRPEVVTMIPFGKRPKTLPSVLSREEVLRLFAALPENRSRTLVRTAYACGLRIGEVVRLRVADCDSRRGVLLVRQGKGQKDRLVPLSPALLAELRGYGQRYRPADRLLPGQRRGRHLHAGALQRIFARLVRPLGFGKPVSMHPLRGRGPALALCSGARRLDPRVRSGAGRADVSAQLLRRALPCDVPASERLLGEEQAVAARW